MRRLGSGATPWRSCAQSSGEPRTPGPAGRITGLQNGHADSGSSCSTHQSPADRNPAISLGLHDVHLDSGSPCSTHQSARTNEPAPTATAPGLQVGQKDSGNPCSAHQSPLAWKTAAKAGLHFVQRASGKPCASQVVAAASRSGTGKVSCVEPGRRQPTTNRHVAARTTSLLIAAGRRRRLWGSLDLEAWVALQALGLGQLMRSAPVTGSLERGDQ